jgi:hypothetical protein
VSSPNPRSRAALPRRRGREMLLALAACLLTLPVLELGLRALGLRPFDTPNPNLAQDSPYRWAEPDAELGWRNRPGVWRSRECGHVPMTFLADGRRSSSPPARADAPTVLFVGGSYAQGYGVGDADTFFERLNRELPDFAFQSLGTGGYGTLQSLLLTERVLDATPPAQRPALVVYALIEGHAKRNVSAPSHILSLQVSAQALLVPPHVRVRDGSLRRFAPELLPTWPLADRVSLLALVERAWVWATHRVGHAESLRATRLLLEEFAESVTSRGPAFAVALLEGSPEGRRAMLSDAPFPSVDCRHEERPEDSVCGDGHGHPGRAVHAWWARCLADWLRAGGGRQKA